MNTMNYFLLLLPWTILPCSKELLSSLHGTQLNQFLSLLADHIYYWVRHHIMELIQCKILALSQNHNILALEGALKIILWVAGICRLHKKKRVLWRKGMNFHLLTLHYVFGTRLNTIDNFSHLILMIVLIEWILLSNLVDKKTETRNSSSYGPNL